MNVLKAVEMAGLGDQAEVTKVSDVKYFFQLGVLLLRRWLWMERFFPSRGGSPPKKLSICSGKRKLSVRKRPGGMVERPCQTGGWRYSNPVKARGTPQPGTAAMASKIAVYLITGFLGSGKTTFLKRIIRSFPADRRLMILMNEFGEIGIDGDPGSGPGTGNPGNQQRLDFLRVRQD